MHLKLTPKARKIIIDKGSQVTISLSKQICYN